MDPEILSTMDQPRFEFALEVRLPFTRVQQITQLPTGGVRSAVYVDSGEFFGPKLKGKAVPNSGGDYALFRPDDVAVFDARYMLQEDDGTLIMLYNKGFLWGRKPDTMDRLRKWAFERFQYNIKKMDHQAELLALPVTSEVTHIDAGATTRTALLAPLSR